jgi:prepilin-type N-terminal cleavage/methylation domain-containing protein
MKRTKRRVDAVQGGRTLIELIIAMAIGLVLPEQARGRLDARHDDARRVQRPARLATVAVCDRTLARPT